MSGQRRWIGAFRFPEQKSVLVALYEEGMLESTTLALAEEVSLRDEERGVIIRHFEVSPKGRFSDIDVETSKRPLDEWLKDKLIHMVRNHLETYLSRLNLE